jgi:hypothetical protein
MKELIDNVAMHYGSTSTARSCIKMWAEAGKIPGVTVKKEAGKLCFCTTPNPPESKFYEMYIGGRG